MRVIDDFVCLGVSSALSADETIYPNTLDRLMVNVRLHLGALVLAHWPRELGALVVCTFGTREDGGKGMSAVVSKPCTSGGRAPCASASASLPRCGRRRLVVGGGVCGRTRCVGVEVRCAGGALAS